MFDSDPLATYRLLEFPSETAESWPIARHDRDDATVRLLGMKRHSRGEPREAKKAAA